MSEASDTQAQAQMSAAQVIVDYMHGEGSTTLQDTLGHANLIARKLSEAGLLISRAHEVAISPERLNELKHAEVKLSALEAGGVDNWEGYDDSMHEIYSAGEDAEFP